MPREKNVTTPGADFRNRGEKTREVSSVGIPFGPGVNLPRTQAPQSHRPGHIGRGRERSSAVQKKTPARASGPFSLRRPSGVTRLDRGRNRPGREKSWLAKKSGRHEFSLVQRGRQSASFGAGYGGWSRNFHRRAVKSPPASSRVFHYTRTPHPIRPCRSLRSSSRGRESGDLIGIEHVPDTARPGDGMKQPGANPLRDGDARNPKVLTHVVGEHESPKTPVELVKRSLKFHGRRRFLGFWGSHQSTPVCEKTKNAPGAADAARSVWGDTDKAKRHRELEKTPLP